VRERERERERERVVSEEKQLDLAKETGILQEKNKKKRYDSSDLYLKFLTFPILCYFFFSPF
jgi:hypothetical protein